MNSFDSTVFKKFTGTMIINELITKTKNNKIYIFKRLNTSFILNKIFIFRTLLLLIAMCFFLCLNRCVLADCRLSTAVIFLNFRNTNKQYKTMKVNSMSIATIGIKMV